MRFLVLLLCFYSTTVFAQVLRTVAPISLSPGSRVYDMEYIRQMNAYVLVGDFTSVNGVPRKYIALVDATTHQVKPNAPFLPTSLDFDGIVRSVEFMTDGLRQSGNNNYYIVLGGDFVTINYAANPTEASFKQGMAVLRAWGTLSPSSSFSLVNWDYATLNYSGTPGSGSWGNGVYDLLVKSDTLYVAGLMEGADVEQNDHFCDDSNFDIVNATCFALRLNSSRPSRFDRLPASYTPPIVPNGYQRGTYGLAKTGGEVTIGTEPNINFQHRRNDFSINSSIKVAEQPGQLSAYFSSPVALNDSMVAYIENVGGFGGEILKVYSTNDLPNGLTSNWEWEDPNFAKRVYGHLAHNGDLIILKSYVATDPGGERNVIRRFELNGETSPGKLSFSPVNAGLPIFPNVSSVTDFSHDTLNNMFLIGNRLFLSVAGMTGVDGQARSGIAEFCLEPENPKDFSTFDTLVCRNDIATYRIPGVGSATGYRWSYSGSNVSYRISGSNGNYSPLVDEYVDNGSRSANGIELLFGPGATSGTLTVQPYANCNTATDYLMATTQQRQITVVPLPNISMADSTALNCYSDSAWIVVGSSQSEVDYSLTYNGITQPIDSLLIDYNNPPFFTGMYYGTVTESVNLCTSTDSTYFSVDRVPPAVTGADIVTTPSVFSCNTSSMEIALDIPGATTSWTYDNDPSVPLPNPFFIYSTDSLNFQANVQLIDNGCSVVQPFQVPVESITATPVLIGHPNFVNEFIDDSLSCITPTLTLECGVNPGTSGTASWLAGNSPTGSTVLNLSEADTAGMVGQVKTYRFYTEHASSGCTDTVSVIVRFDFNSPFVATHSGNESINCSQTSAFIVHQQSGNPVEGWLDSFGNQTGSNELTATSPGDYYYQVEGANGCINTDTVTVEESQDILVGLPEDTLVCPDQSVSIVANPVLANGETPTFQWSDGSTTNTGNAIGGVDSELTVVVQTTSGCVGYDTTALNITAPIVADISSLAACNEGALQIESVSGGAGNYQFSLDQINWQTSTAFTGLPLGTYTLYVRDDLGCVYDFSETIGEGSQSVLPNFLAPTYNAVLDTVVVVNFQSFAGYDSMQWRVPPGADIVVETDSLLVFSVGSEGWVDVSLVGYLDTCESVRTKALYFGEGVEFSDSTEALGIISLTVFPNPTNGTFTVECTLGATQNYTVLVSSAMGQPFPSMITSGFGDAFQQDFNFPLGTQPGSYIIHVVADYDAEHRTLILN